MNRNVIILWVIVGGFIFGSSFGAKAQFQQPYPVEAQLPEWASMMYAPDADIGGVLEAYDAYYANHPFEKNQHTQYLKRWLYRISHDVMGLETGNFSPEEKRKTIANNRAYTEKSIALRSKRSPTSPWSSIGPIDWDHEAASKSYAPGAAHVYSVEQCASQPDVLYAATATAGIWKTTDRGTSWSLLTRDMMVNGVYALEVDHSDGNTVYASLFSSIYKTTDGGTTWNPTGSVVFQANAFSAKDIVMHPTQSLEVFAATDGGLYKTTDGGTNWTLVLTGSFLEVEYHPTRRDTIYTVKQVNDVTEFYRSTDGGNTFVQKPTGWPAPISPDQQKRTEIAVTPDNPDKVYALCTGAVNGGAGLYGIYISNDAGNTWTFSCCGPQPGGPADLSTTPPNINMMGWSDVGSDDGGQYYYDLSLAVSPTHQDSIFVCGVNLWVSGDGGNSFTCPSKWSHSNKPNYVHADIHDIHYYPNGEIWVGCDGGIFYSNDNGANFTRKITGIAGTDFWGFGVGFWDGEVMLGGTYHNGTLLKNESVYINDWLCTDGGDGIRGFVNFGKEKTAYSDYNKKELPNDRLTSIPTFAYDKKPNASYIIGESSQIEFDPRCYNHFLSGNGDQLWKTENDGSTFSLVHDFGEKVTDVEIAWSNPDVIYVATWPGYWSDKKLYKTTNGGTTWTEITPATTVFSAKRWISYEITISGTNENEIWLARMAQSTTAYDGEKIYHSTDGGTTWTNLTTTTLNGEQISHMVHQRGSDGGIYLGTRRAVYYRNRTMPDWALFNNDLPISTLTVRLAPYYREGKIRTGTNRSAYECDFYEDALPVAQISADKLEVNCTRDTVYFYDHSALTETGASWEWTFPGATWVDNLNSRTPKVIYGNTGTFDVSLEVADVFGTSSQTLNGLITVTDGCNADTLPGQSLQCTGTSDYIQTQDLGITTQNFTITAWVKLNGLQDDYASVVMNDGDGAGLNFRGGNNTLGYHWPGGAWWWNSGLVVPQEEWAHVAMVATPTSMTVYLNGVGVTHTTNLTATAITSLKIGSYKGWTSRNFRGELDEVSIWNRSLSQSEIRELRHLTRDHLVDPADPAYDPALLIYYQFNEVANQVMDKVGLNHGDFSGTSARVLSTVPVGGGESDRLTVTTGGTYAFADAGMDLVFPAIGFYPNGELVVSRIHTTPDSLPNANPHMGCYWVVNNYGTNATFSRLSQLVLTPPAGLPSAQILQDPTKAILHRRDDNAHLNNWVTLCGASQVSATPGSDFVYDHTCNLSGFSQFFPVSSDVTQLLPLEELNFQAEALSAQKVILTWLELAETNAETYRVLHSPNGQSFELLQTISANPGTGISYQTYHEFPPSGINHYQLQVIDREGEVHHSQVQTVFIENEGIRVFPNPASASEELVLVYNGEGELAFKLFDVKGKNVLETVPVGIGTRKAVSLTGIAPGVYMYSVRGKAFKQNGKLVIR